MHESINRKSIVVHMVDSLLDRGIVNKQDIIAKVVQDTGFPRPTVRRIIRDMRKDMIKKINILHPDYVDLPK